MFHSQFSGVELDPMFTLKKGLVVGRGREFSSTIPLAAFKYPEALEPIHIE